MNRRYPSLMWLAVILFIADRATAQLSARPPTSQSTDNAITVDRDIPYVDGGVAAQRLDIYRPTVTSGNGSGNPSAKPLPLIVWIHGGGWLMGSKSYCPSTTIVGAGYELASVEYRFSTAAKLPAQIQDCQAAVRWLRAHHEQYGFDPDRIGVMGESAGGHLAALLGTASGRHQFEFIGEDKTVSDQVQAVCDCYGPADFTTLIAQIKADPTVHNIFAKAFTDNAASADSTDLYKTLTGKKLGEDPAMDSMASPVTYITPHDPPFLILHGDRDNLVPVAQSVELADKLKMAGDSVVLQIIHGAGHGGRSFFDPRALTLVRNFFDHTLKGIDVPVEANPSLSKP